MRNEKGFTLIELLVVILIIGILLALMIPNFSLFQERARRASVKNNMHVLQTSIEAFATDHFGSYPYVAGLISQGEEHPLVYYMPGGDIYNPPEEGTMGNVPVNPYTGVRYNDNDPGFEDMTYGDLLEFDFSGQNSRTSGLDEDCIYIDQAGLNEDYSGFITVGVWPPADDELLPPLEYGIIGWGRNTEEDDYPMYDIAAGTDDPFTTDNWIFYVLHN
jgi:prepilin-type N-terminal cleavage/methylation domain-containing protein